VVEGPLAGAGELAVDSVRVRVDLAYDGAGFSGWAAQPGRRTVEGVLSEALGHVLRLPGAVRLTVAGRTDSGVHARGQVAHADMPADAWGTHAGAALRRLARALPPDIRVRSAGVAPPGFDARFSALWRRYAYRICDEPARADPLRRFDTLWSPRSLDLGAMNEAARLLLGEHDFAAFCRKREGATTVRALRRLEWERGADGVAVGCVVADAFCHNMVRALVGALIPVGEGSRPTGWPAQVLREAVRDPGVQVVPPHGLSLEEVRYPEPEQLAARAALTRQVRGADLSLLPGLPGCLDYLLVDDALAVLLALVVGALPVTIRWLRSGLAVPDTRSLLKCSSWLSSAVVVGSVPLTNSAQVRIR